MIFSYISTFLKTSLFVVILNNYFKNNYPDQHEEFIITTSFNLINLYSKCQIIATKICYKVKQLVLSNPRLSELLNNYYRCHGKKDLEFVLNGEIIYSTNREKYANDPEIPRTYDFIILSDYKILHDNSCVNKKILKALPDVDENFEYEVSDIKFILTEIKINNKKIKINFKTTNYNYYIVNNIFNDKFLKYFLNKYEDMPDFSDEDMNNINISILDNNVNKIDCKNKDWIQIKKTHYTKLDI